MPFGNNCICNRQNCTRFARAITLPITHAIIPKSHSNPCDYPYKLLRGAVSILNDGRGGVGFQECIYKSKVPYYIQTYIHNCLYLAVQLYKGGSLYIFLMAT